MRPCNQCRKPIENSQQLCAECEQYNRDHGLTPKPSVSLNPYDPATQKPLPFDQTVNLLLLAFAASVFTFFTLLGYMVAGRLGLALGVVASLVATTLFSSTMRG